MALDPSIILQAGKGVTPLMSPDEIQDQRMQREVNSLKLGQLRQGLADDQTQRQIAQSTAPEGLAGAYYKAGLVKPAQEAMKFQTEQQKASHEAQKAKIEEALQHMNFVAQTLTGVNDQAGWERAKATVASKGMDVSGLPAQFDPAFIEQQRMKALPIKEQLMQKWKEMEYTTPNANAKLQASTSTANNAATNAQSAANNANTVSASRENAAATRAVADATKTAATAQRDQSTEMKLSDDYRAQSKDFQAVGDAYRQINATLDKATTSPAATLAAATKFMKLLDPGSVVRESELGMALQASGVFDRATNYVNTLARGKVLTPTQVADFKNITGQIYGAAQEGQKTIDADYTQRAKTYGLRPENIVQQLGQNKGAAPKQAVKRTGTLNGRKVVEYADGTMDYAD